MAEAGENHTRFLLDRRLPVVPGWMGFQEAFCSLTDVVGAPSEAVHDLSRVLLSGRVPAMRRRRLDDRFEDSVLPRTFWRDVKLYWDRDEQGRDCIGLRLAKGVDPAIVSGCFFYLLRERFHEAFPATVPKPPRRRKPRTVYDRVCEILAELDRENQLRGNLAPAEVERIVLPKYHAPDRWPGEKVSRNTITDAYRDYCAAHPK